MYTWNVRVTWSDTLNTIHDIRLTKLNVSFVSMLVLHFLHNIESIFSLLILKYTLLMHVLNKYVIKNIKHFL